MIHNWGKWKDEYKEACSIYNEFWAILDRALYNLCKNFSSHSRKNEISAKVVIISRTYLTGLERHSKVGMTGIINCFFDNREEIDRIFKELKTIEEPLSEKKLLKIVSFHGDFLDILKKTTRGKNIVRSFASKYMHFHSSAVPIFDRISSKVIKQRDWYPLTNRDITRFSACPVSDKIYADYCARFFSMYNDLRESGINVIVKELDHYLLWCEE